MSLSEANAKLIANDVFAYTWVKNNEKKWVVGDGKQKNMLNYGETYEKAVNVLAEQEYNVISYADSWFSQSNASIDLKSYLQEREFDFNVNYIHMRTNTENHADNINYHSVLFAGFKYNADKTLADSVDILDPWTGPAERKYKDISRADTYMLTPAGKKLYDNTRARYFYFYDKARTGA